MPLLDAEVAGQATAARQPLDRRSGRLEHSHVGLEAHDRRLVTMRLHDKRRTGQIGPATPPYVVAALPR